MRAGSPRVLLPHPPAHMPATTLPMLPADAPPPPPWCAASHARIASSVHCSTVLLTVQSGATNVSHSRVVLSMRAL